MIWPWQSPRVARAQGHCFLNRRYAGLALGSLYDEGELGMCVRGGLRSDCFRELRHAVSSFSDFAQTGTGFWRNAYGPVTRYVTSKLLTSLSRNRRTFNFC